MNWIYKKLFPVWNVHRNDTKNFHYLVNWYGFFNSLICETIRFYLITTNVRIITRLWSLVCDVMCVSSRDSVTKLWQSPERRDVCPTELASQTKLSSAQCAAHSPQPPGRAGADPSEPGARAAWLQAPADTARVISVYANNNHNVSQVWYRGIVVILEGDLIHIAGSVSPSSFFCIFVPLGVYMLGSVSTSPAEPSELRVCPVITWLSNTDLDERRSRGRRLYHLSWVSDTEWSWPAERNCQGSESGGCWDLGRSWMKMML